jgi:hypothetical protein
MVAMVHASFRRMAAGSRWVADGSRGVDQIVIGDWVICDWRFVIRLWVRNY